MNRPHPLLDELARDLDGLAGVTPRPEPPEVVDARDAIRRAAETLAHGTRPAFPGADGERALGLARLAVERARRAIADAGPPRLAWQDALQAPRPAPRTPQADRRPRGSVRHADVSVDSEIPDTHPAKTAIEASVAAAFAGVKGKWQVAIIVQPNTAWWGIRVKGDSICWTGTLEGPDEQSAEFLGGRVRDVVRLGLMESAMRDRRHRD